MKTVFAFLIILVVAVSVHCDENSLSDDEVNELKAVYKSRIESRFGVNYSKDSIEVPEITCSFFLNSYVNWVKRCKVWPWSILKDLGWKSDSKCAERWTTMYKRNAAPATLLNDNCCPMNSVLSICSFVDCFF